jgi:hypothetical protein
MGNVEKEKEPSNQFVLIPSNYLKGKIPWQSETIKVNKIPSNLTELKKYPF